jgi:hypothetical protein
MEHSTSLLHFDVLMYSLTPESTFLTAVSLLLKNMMAVAGIPSRPHLPISWTYSEGKKIQRFMSTLLQNLE